ncbi:MAG TPA: zinc ribbon domain-containing protein [Vicinamibacterales bacterium]|jgi:hypothetical protein|nr:zinc ribbon domain-containing protein [Vicinamibacterales bacterium]
MSSETSTESQQLQPWQLFTLAALFGATVVVFVSRDVGPAGVILLSITVGATAFVGMAAWRMLAPLTGREEPAGPDVIGGRTRAALEREKTLVLRSIKDLEFDRAMGKIAEKDFVEMGARLRARAARLMRQLDSGANYREEIEQEIAKRVGVAPDGSVQDKRAGRGSRPGTASATPVADARAVAARVCACGVANDPDARFCKGCGTKLETA